MFGTITRSQLLSTAAEVAARLLIWCFVAFPVFVLAGGSTNRVTVESLTVGDHSFELRVIPTSVDPKYSDPYIGQCKEFTVRGEYAWLYTWRFPAFVDYSSHKAALEYLQRAYAAKEPVILGWIGEGFSPVDPKDPCVVRSRALTLWRENGETSVLSFYKYP